MVARAGAARRRRVRLVRGGGETGEAGDLDRVRGGRWRRRVREALRAAGARPVGPAAFESLRIEAGTPLFPVTTSTTAVLLPEMPFEDLVSHTKGCYPGQEVVVRIRDRGHVNRHLRGLVLEGDAVPAGGRRGRGRRRRRSAR